MLKLATTLAFLLLAICVLMAFERNAGAFAYDYNQIDKCSLSNWLSFSDWVGFVLCNIEGPFGSLVMIVYLIISGFLFLMKGKKRKSFALLFLLISIAFFFLRALTSLFFKPVIYLYPEKAQDISVQLDYSGKLTATYPSYDFNVNGWNVTAYPDGKLIDLRDKKEYSYLFWEGVPSEAFYKMPKAGFVVKGEDSAVFLQKILSEAGLKPVEYNELIVFWYPQIKDYPFVQIAFAGSEYEETAKLTINPKPDSILRVFLYFKKLSADKKIEPQTIPDFQRKGFSVVEWGGTIMP